jgi:hypothetical protein
MEKKSGWKRITLLGKTSFKKRLKLLAGYKRQPGNNPECHKLTESTPGKRRNRPFKVLEFDFSG